ncbi:hypothetical protein [Neptunitalea lumnitzerae]|nr:hypothetical protein [Neptunitalea sp. Y10]
MDTLQNIILTFSKEEQKQCVAFLKNKNRRGDAKNIELFTLLLDPTLTQQTIIDTLYNTATPKNTFHALKKRLYQSVINFVASNAIKTENSTEMQLIKLIVTARSFFLKKHYQLGFSLLAKAEQIASEYALYSILNEILHTHIQYIEYDTKTNLQTLKQKVTQTHEALLLEDQLNIAYAEIKQIVKAIEHEGKVIDFLPAFTEVMQQFRINEALLSFKSLYQIIEITSMKAFVTNNYLYEEDFLLSLYKQVKGKHKRESMLYYHIAILYHIANVYFRNKKFDGSLAYLQYMETVMKEQKGKYQSIFMLKHQMLLALNENFTNNAKGAINRLIPFVEKSSFASVDELDITLALIMMHLQQKEFKKAQQLFTKLTHTDAWYEKKAGREWVIKKNLMELLLFIDLGYVELVEARLKRFKKNYFNYLKAIGQQRVITYVKLITLYYTNPEKIQTIDYKNKVEDSFEWLSHKREDIFVMCFYAWLKSKMYKTDVYNTTLELVYQVQAQ